LDKFKPNRQFNFSNPQFFKGDKIEQTITQFLTKNRMNNRAVTQLKKFFWSRSSRMLKVTDEELRNSSLLPIFRLAYEQFGKPLDAEGLETLIKLAEYLDPHEIGCAESPTPLWANKKQKACLWTEIFENKNLCFNIFRMPTGFSLPVHDHPGMTGVNTIIHGKIQYTGYSWKQKPTQESNNKGILVFEKSGESTPSNNKCIPTQTGAGNVHTLRAVEDTTVFQVLCPNYEYQERPCSFFSLTEIEKHIYEVTITESADDYLCGQVPYTGISGKLLYSFVQQEEAERNLQP